MSLEFLSAAITTGAEGTFRAVASARDSIANGERGPTRFAENAFRESLERSARYPLLWQHKDDAPVGVAHLSMDSAEGLVLDGQLALEVQRGREARELLKMGALDGVSIGFTAEKARMETHGGKSVRVVEKAKLMEVSLVTFPADPNARVLTVHREGDPDEQLADWMAEVEATLLNGDIEAHAGRVFSEGNLTKLRAALGTLVDLVEKVDPGHIAALGRRAAKTLKKSIILMPGKAKKATASAAVRADRMRRAEMHAAGIDVPLLRLEPYPAYVAEGVNPDDALLNAISGACSYPKDARRMLTVESVKQYLVAIGEAEEADDDDEMRAPEDGREPANAPEDGSATKNEGAA
jgi:hypothetical protein